MQTKQTDAIYVSRRLWSQVDAEYTWQASAATSNSVTNQQKMLAPSADMIAYAGVHPVAERLRRWQQIRSPDNTWLHEIRMILQDFRRRLTPTFWTENWHTSYSWQAFTQILLFSTTSVFEFGARTGRTNRQTDGRAGKTRNVAFRTAAW